jgi:hypothetical protein
MRVMGGSAQSPPRGLPRKRPRGPLANVPTHTVFAQTADMALPISALQAHAERHFDLSIAVAEASPTGATSTSGTRFDVRTADAAGTYVITVRPRTAEDASVAREAERRGNAAGMGALAERCSNVWLVEASPGAPEWLTWDFCALLAFAALGPILPEDGSTLLGLRSARARAERLRAESRNASGT